MSWMDGNKEFEKYLPKKKPITLASIIEWIKLIVGFVLFWQLILLIKPERHTWFWQ